MNGIMFFIQCKSTGSSSRGILSGGRILSREDLMDEKIFSSATSRYSRWSVMYQVGNTELRDSKSMQLDEFDQFFTKEEVMGMTHLFNIGRDKESIFRKDIVNKYFPVPKPKTTTVYNVGDVIVADFRYLYCGEFAWLSFMGKEYSGHLYLPMYSEVFTNGVDSFIKATFASFVNKPYDLDRCIMKTKKKAQVGMSLGNYDISGVFHKDGDTAQMFSVTPGASFYDKNPVTRNIGYVMK